MKKLYTLISLLAVSIASQAQVNLIPNSDFETFAAGVPSSWFIPASTTISQGSGTNVYAGTSSCGVTSPATSNKTISPTADIPVTQGVTYVFSGWYLDNNANAKFKNWNQFRTLAGTGGADTGANALQAADFSVDSASWQFFTAESIPNPASGTVAAATVARAGLRVYPETTTASGGVIYFDDIKFFDKSTLSVNINEFDNQIKMATVLTDVLTIQMPSRATVNIYSIDGKLYSSNRVDSNEAINIQSLVSGVYVVTIQNDVAKTSRRFLKK